MDRRSFVKNSSLTLTGIWLGAGLFSGCKKPDLSGSDRRVIIIGAGVAGLAAGAKLQETGLQNITVLEASFEMGGRVRTIPDWGFPMDLGASWIHGASRANPLDDLAESAGMTTVKTDDESVKIYDSDGSEYSDNTISDYESQYKDLIKDVINGGSKDKSVRQRVEEVSPSALQDRLMLYQLSAYEEFDYGADINQLNSKFFQEDDKFRGKDQFVVNGYDRLPRLLAKKLNVLLGQKVTAIDYSGAEIRVETAGGMEFFADEVIIAIPLGVLKSGNVTITPALPATHSEPISRMEMGVTNKVALKFDAPFWDTNLQYIGFTPSEKGKYNYFLNYRKFSPYNVLLTFAFGDFGRAMESHSDAQVQADVMAHLRAIYGSSIPDPTEIIRTAWGSNPLFMGAYTPAVVGMEGDEFTQLSQPIDNRVYLAGEHCSQDYRGTVHGALLSGQAAAEKIIEKISD